jgi:hypothetical protein
MMNYVPIPPKFFRAADKGLMEAVGKGDMIVEVPNAGSINELLVRDVLYSPLQMESAQYTLRKARL